MFFIMGLGVTYGFIFSLGAIALEKGHYLLSLVFFVLVPVFRIRNRFKEGKGYWIIGYEGEAGHHSNFQGRCTFQEHPVRFKLYLLAEILMIGFLLFMLFIHFSEGVDLHALAARGTSPFFT